MTTFLYMAALILVLLGAAPASAQGISSSTGGNGQTFVLTASTAGGYDDNLAAADTSGAGDPAFQLGGRYASANTGLNYSARGGAGTFAASGFTDFRYYDVRDQVTTQSYGGSVGASAGLGSRFSLSGSMTTSHASQYSIWVFPAMAPAPPGQIFNAPIGPAYGLSPASATSVQSGVAMGYQLSKRSFLSGEYGFGRTMFEGSTPDLRVVNYGARYSLGLTKYASFRLGYSQQRADYRAARGANVRYGSVDAGIDYGRPLSISRKTKLTFGVGSNSVATEAGGSTYWNVSGHADLSHEFKTSNVTLSYNRGIQLVDGLSSPVSADGVTANAMGRFARLRVTLSTAYSNGVVGVSQPILRRFSSYTGSARAEFALLRRLGVFGEYVYYRYKFDNQIALPEGTPHDLDRQGLRAGLSLTVPLLQERNSRAAR